MSEHSQQSSGKSTPASASPSRSHSSSQPTPASPCSQSSVQPTPASASPPQPMNYVGQWSTGLCDCDDNVTNCCITFWCPCITFGQIAEIVDEGTTSCEVHAVLYVLLLIVTGGGEAWPET